MSSTDAIRELGELLVLADARPSIDRRRIAPSTLYDANYHVAMIACAFTSHARRDESGRERILAAWLKMLQFVAARPRLAEDLRTWVSGRRVPDLTSWNRMPRGYIGDRTHDATVDYLVATAVLDRQQDEIVAGERVHLLYEIVARLSRALLFIRERGIMEGLRDVRPSKAMLGGG